MARYRSEVRTGNAQKALLIGVLCAFLFTALSFGFAAVLPAGSDDDCGVYDASAAARGSSYAVIEVGSLRLLKGENAIQGARLAPSESIIPEPDKEELARWLKTLLANVYATDLLEEDERRDLQDMVKGMLYAVEFDNPILLKVIYLGLKYALGSNNMDLRELNAVKDILTTYGILE